MRNDDQSCDREQDATSCANFRCPGGDRTADRINQFVVVAPNGICFLSGSGRSADATRRSLLSVFTGLGSFNGLRSQNSSIGSVGRRYCKTKGYLTVAFDDPK